MAQLRALGRVPQGPMRMQRDSMQDPSEPLDPRQPPIQPPPPPTDPEPPNTGGGQDSGQGARGSETPRERGGDATPTRPMSPDPVVGHPPVQVTQPLPSESPMALTSTLRSRGLFGGAGGLTGGGLGVPFDPTSNSQSDPINTLLKKLLGGGGGF